ncbi:MAG: hypothetical protein ACFCVD_08390 [Nodosilinea sp.]
MQFLVQKLTLPTLALTLALASSAAAQPVAQTPLAQPVQTSGSVNPTRSSACGFLADGAAQVLQVTQEFASVDITVSGDSGLTLQIQGSNGFSECLTTSGLSGNSVSAPGLLNQGTYNFFVGNASQTPTSYTLTIREN